MQLVWASVRAGAVLVLAAPHYGRNADDGHEQEVDTPGGQREDVRGHREQSSEH